MSSSSGVEDLKALLQSSVGGMELPGHSLASSSSSVERAGAAGMPRAAAGVGTARQEIPVLDELASLIGSVDFDLNPAKQSTSRPLPGAAGVRTLALLFLSFLNECSSELQDSRLSLQRPFRQSNRLDFEHERSAAECEAVPGG